MKSNTYCVCGCGTIIGAGRRYAQGHNSKRDGVASGGERDDPNPGGLCMCGCGGRTAVATYTSTKAQRYKGKHMRFVSGHHSRVIRGADRVQWKGGRIVTKEGYVRVAVPYESGSRAPRYRSEHRVVMEQVLGRPLAIHEQVHHLNGDKQDNRPENLELWNRSQPNGVRQGDFHCSGCTCAIVGPPDPPRPTRKRKSRAKTKP